LYVVRARSGIGSAENRETANLAHARGRTAAIMLTPIPARD
jgi:hypothetical protein